MKYKIFNAKGGFTYGSEISVNQNGTIKEIKDEQHVKSSETEKWSGNYIIPGLIDLHFHGCLGHEFATCNSSGMVEIAKYQLKNGITTIAPALLTLPVEELKETCALANKTLFNPYINNSNFNKIQTAHFAGINLEGPFVSPQKLGAQNPKYAIKPNIKIIRELMSIAPIKLLDLAPELDGALELIKELKNEMVLSIAHTVANYEQAFRAFEYGATHCTHLFNAMPPFLHREPGVIGAALDCSGVSVEIIADGVHLHPAVVRAVFKMFGKHRVVLISDSMKHTGLGNGISEIGGMQVEVNGKEARLSNGGALAGSVSNLFDCFSEAVSNMRVDLWSAINATTVNPAKVLGIYNQVGSLEKGKFANYLILNNELELKEVYISGKQVV